MLIEVLNDRGATVQKRTGAVACNEIGIWAAKRGAAQR